MTSATSIGATQQHSADNTQPLLHIRNLTKRYGRTTAVDSLELDLTAGRVVGLLGENGCGKTTLLKILAGAEQDYTGEISILGNAPGPATKAVTAFLPDAEFLPRGMRVSYCLDAYADFFADFNRERAGAMLTTFKLSPDMRLKDMSKGMREKVQVALTMSRDARLFLLDEPISGVDPAAREEILDGILQHIAEDSVLLITTHLIHDLEPILDTVAFMRQGKIILTGDADDLRAQYGSSLDQIFREVYR